MSSRKSSTDNLSATEDTGLQENGGCGGAEARCQSPVGPSHRQTKSLDDTSSPNCSGNSLSVPAKDRRAGRRGSTCHVLHQIPTIVQTQAYPVEKTYIKKDSMTEEDVETNREIFNQIMAAEFPEEDMIDKSHRDKDKDWVMKTWILEVLGELEDTMKAKCKKIQATEEYEFYLQSGVILCNLGAKIVPSFTVDKKNLQSNNLLSRRKNINQFLSCAAGYGVPRHLLFNVDDLATLAHVHKVTRTLFAFAELTKQDPTYNGPEFNYEKILSDLVTHGIRRKSSCRDMDQVNTSIHSIFANLMEDVQRKNSLTPKGPPKNIYYNNN